MWFDVGLGMRLPRKARNKIRTLRALCLMCDGVYNMSCMLCELCDQMMNVLCAYVLGE